MVRRKKEWILLNICKAADTMFEQAPGLGDGQGSLASCSPWSHKESDMTEHLNWNWDILVISHFVY